MNGATQTISCDFPLFLTLQLAVPSQISTVKRRLAIGQQHKVELMSFKWNHHDQRICSPFPVLV